MARKEYLVVLWTELFFVVVDEFSSNLDGIRGVHGFELMFNQNTCLLPLPNWYYLFLYGSGLTGKRTRLPSKIIKME